MIHKSVLLFGASGLVGSHVLTLLLKDLSVEKVVVFVRSPIQIDSPKVQVVLSDLKDLDQLNPYFISAETLLCCLGTTLKKVKTKEAFKAVDYDLPVNIAKKASLLGVKKFIVISSLGADVNSKNFYLRTKGEMERDVAKFKFQKLAFLRPSFLVGHRNEFRLGERIMIFIVLVFQPFFIGRFAKYRPIYADSVAKAMISISQSLNNNRIYQSEELKWLGD